MPAHFAILRTAKLKSFGNVGGSLSHTYRTRETTNADPDRCNDNEHSHNSPAEVMQVLRDRLPDKYRKDAVIGLEYFVGASPQWFDAKTREQQDAYFHESIEWLQQRHGKENVVGWSIHRDETSPHLVAYVVPMSDRGTLNAKQWTGGAATLSKMQTDFAKNVGARNDLERGIEGSKAHHQTIKGFYAQIGQAGQQIIVSPAMTEPKVLKKNLFSTEYETPETVAQRVTGAVQRAYTPTIEQAKLAVSERRRADEMTRTAEALSATKKRSQSERVNAIKAEREKEAEKYRTDYERSRRIDDLGRVERTTAGAAHTFAQHALKAVEKAGGDVAKVEWEKVEAVAIRESIMQHNQDPRKVLAAIVKHSPGMVDQARQEKAREFISTWSGKEISASKVNKGREGPSM
ncbi:hypothetical protein RirG_031960 [Rhizophagus irregularis DAOM 197198w]|uniref:Plasmid recombination enzyme n=1 Tax=Rhizophagus irregularis (strain DAOM 197198w) TaxID=1432141 RepID=A0A015LA43_RHIIW|nr:hypothetical protein RirG_031960 [Rhizophagus irregularis DAOM 197198w]